MRLFAIPAPVRFLRKSTFFPRLSRKSEVPYFEKRQIPASKAAPHHYLKGKQKMGKKVEFFFVTIYVYMPKKVYIICGGFFVLISLYFVLNYYSIFYSYMISGDFFLLKVVMLIKKT